MKVHELLIFADYSQIIVEDIASMGQYEVEWNAEEIKSMLHVEENTIVIGTARNMEVPFLLKVFESRPLIDQSEWDHIVECSLNLKSGTLCISGPTDYKEDAFKMQLPTGLYNAMICYKGLNSISDDGLEGDDSYSVLLWNSNIFLPKKVLKQWGLD